jgi:Ca2+/H+ antiporter
MALDYDPFSVLALLLAVVHTALITLDSRSHWIMGVELIIVYR